MNDLLIRSQRRDLGGFTVARSLPCMSKLPSVGPFVFLDHMGPMSITDQSLLDVRPHPHIGLATATYLISGSGYHRDSLGSDQVIEPGELNWMTAGSGIVHSERTPKSIPRDGSVEIHGIQVWIGLPVSHEKTSPSFTHYGKEVLPELELCEGLSGRLMIGRYQNTVSPVKTFSPTFFADVSAKKNLKQNIQFNDEQIGIFLIEGGATINGMTLEKDDLLVLKNPQSTDLHLDEGAHLIIIGGEGFPEKRYIWWNFVASNKEDIHRAAERWKSQEFPSVHGETDFIPLPETQLP